MKIFRILVAFFLLQISYTGYAQLLEVGGGLGTMLYAGELSTYYNLRYANPGAKALLKFNLNSASVLTISASAGYLTANGANEGNRIGKTLNGSSFSTPLYEIATEYEYNFFDYRKYKSRRRGTPYISGGVAGFVFNPVAVEPAGKVSNFQFAIPFGVGYKYALTRNLNLNFEASFRKTFTQYLDNSANFIPNDPLTQKLNPKGDPPQRGFKLLDDWYMFTGVTLTYTFYSVQCPFPEYW